MTMNVPGAPTRKPRYGTIKIIIGSNHVIKGPDGIKRQYTTRDKSRFPKVKCVAVCLKCAKTFESEEDLLASHPDERVLRKQEEAHAYGFWSDEPLEPVEKTDNKVDKLEKADKKLNPVKVVGLLSDLE